eukprot:TRINITY_DN55155_c0_g1_i2.p1 TRINITY_DN55155_c0_g1~~TRINITY_DN55155_c0_g1_i2.p1  ORF type:complete len:403 (-),score=63.29 TRINITY_DN55155_c0_g1_i2:99-1307(-)
MDADLQKNIERFCEAMRSDDPEELMGALDYLDWWQCLVEYRCDATWNARGDDIDYKEMSCYFGKVAEYRHCIAKWYSPYNAWSHNFGCSKPFERISSETDSELFSRKYHPLTKDSHPGMTISRLVMAAGRRNCAAALSKSPKVSTGEQAELQEFLASKPVVASLTDPDAIALEAKYGRWALANACRFGKVEAVRELVVAFPTQIQGEPEWMALPSMALPSDEGKLRSEATWPLMEACTGVMDGSRFNNAPEGIGAMPDPVVWEQIIDILLQHGAKLVSPITPENNPYPDSYVPKPLAAACTGTHPEASPDGRSGAIAVVKALLAAGADVGEDEGRAFWNACGESYPEVVQLLIEAGADVNGSRGTERSWTPWLQAERNFWFAEEVKALLIAAGCNKEERFND